MHCPTCGHSNNDLATRCSACGSPLPSQPTSQATSESQPDHIEERGTLETPQFPTDLESTAGRTYATGDPTEEHTAEREPVSDETPQANDVEEPGFHEVKETAGKFVSAKRNRFLSFLQQHQRGLGIGIAFTVIGVMGVVWFLMSLTNGPAINQIEADLAELEPTYPYVGGAYGPDLDVPLSQVNIISREATQTPANTSPSEGVGPGTYNIDAELLYDDGKMKVTRNVNGTYVRSDDGWLLTGELAETGTSLTPQAGVDEAKVLGDVDTILSMASKGSESLGDVYADGSFSIAGNNFEPNPDKDTATNEVVIHCERKSSFFTYSGSITAHFAFESGEWRLRSAEADESATTRTYNQLVGTWSGSMVAHEAEGGSCFGAREYPVTITIASVGDSSQGSGQVQGTISCLAHYHDKLKSDKSSSEGDTQVENVSFWGVISTEYDKTTGSSLNIECSTSGETRGKISFVLSFGTSDDPSAAIARVTTTHEYEEYILLVVPRQTMARFTDTYVLSRED